MTRRGREHGRSSNPDGRVGGTGDGRAGRDYISEQQGIPVETILVQSQVILDRATVVWHGPSL
jgi:hypothetical protein